MSIPAGSQLCIREVWDRNLSTEIAHINRLKDKFCFLAIDTEFPGALSWKNPHQTSQEDHEYQILKVNVDNLALIQLGLTLTDEHGNLPIIDSTYCIWQFNFCDFDINTDIYSPPSIELLINAGIDFQKNRTDGLEAWKFGAYLVKYDLVCNSNMQYICFSGDYDFAYLLKVLTGELLPRTKAEFDLKVNWASRGLVLPIKLARIASSHHHVFRRSKRNI